MHDQLDLSYPRPGLVRDEWLPLDGEWTFDFDDEQIGEAEHWEDRALPLRIRVPFCYQSAMSGIGDTRNHPCVWYKRAFEVPESYLGKRLILHFDAVDYACKVFVNGQLAAEHQGGHVPFEIDITRHMRSRANELALRVMDELSWSQPLGKQCPSKHIDRCWYTPTTGIWRSVWLEPVNDCYVRQLYIRPDVRARCVSLEAELDGQMRDGELRAEITLSGKPVAFASCRAEGSRARLVIPIGAEDYVDEVNLWSPERPVLYDVAIELWADGRCDALRSYFGMRSIGVAHDRVLLNGRPVYQKLVLNQGYWKESLMTPPNAQALERDIRLIKEMGFNGVRVHQKIEDDRFYYLADKLGLLVWGEMPSCYAFDERAVSRLTSEWTQVLLALRNHPCIITWVPLNESWGVRDIRHDIRQQHYALSLYHLTKAIDPDRLVSANDGWEQVDSDLCCIHDYFPDENAFGARYADMDQALSRDAEGRAFYAEGFAYAGQPVILSEYGGISYGAPRADGNWGYNDHAPDAESFLLRLRENTGCILKHARVRGFCYTQLTDVMQERNGLLDEEHNPKVPVARLREIFCAADQKLLAGYLPD